MRLSKKELEVMHVLWESKVPLSATDIVEASAHVEGRTWKLKSIYIILNALLEKEAIVLSTMKPTQTNSAKAFAPTVTKEEYVVMYARSLDGLNMATLSKAFKELDEKRSKK